jgi:hypothetical protein
MSAPPASKLIQPGDDAYSTVYDYWVEQGSPSGTFDRMGEWGGALYRVRYTDAGVPHFYQARSDVPTLYDDESYAERPYQVGWWEQNRNYGMIRAWWRGWGYKSFPQTRLRRYQSNDLEPEDTV